MKILIDKNIPYADLLFSKVGDLLKVDSKEIKASLLSDVDALIVRSVTKVNKDLLKDSNVRFVGTVTSGIDHIDTEWLYKSGISFTSAPGCNSISVVEYVLSSLFRLSQINRFFLRDKTIGIIGVGNIGSLLKKRLNILGINVLQCDPILEKLKSNEYWCSLEEIVYKSDIITLHVPLVYDGKYPTYHLINKDLLESLPTNKIIINTSRGEVIDNFSLLKELENGKKIKLVLDVWEFEPNFLLPLLNYVSIATPHIAGYSLESKIRGIVYVYNSYNKFIDKNYELDFLTLIPKSRIDHVHLNGAFEIDILQKLSYLIYDVIYDDLQFRNTKYFSNVFNYLRDNYYSRREWSSILIETYDKDSKDKFCNLGFKSKLLL